jgi:RNA polymerase sigma-70 factor (ECF subfamily)
MTDPVERTNPEADVAATKLLTRVAGGDQAAVRACIDTFGPLVWSLARRFSATNEDAEDSVQEIFTDVWRSAGRFDRDRATAHGFVAMIARRRLIDRRRKEDRRPVLVALPEGMEPADNTHVALERRLQAQQVVRALDRLKPQQKRWLELSLLHGLSHSEIATETEAPLGTVKTGIRRGLAQLRGLFAENDTMKSNEVRDA